MDYWNNENNIREYIKMAEGYDGRELIKILKKYLLKGTSVLELGMGSGKDLDILSKDYIATGTDISKIFINLYKKNHKNSDVFVLDAITLQIDRKFDCIYSNKTLQHLTRSEFKQSIQRQKVLLNPNGILFHSLWRGDKEEKYGDLLFVYYTKEKLIELVRNDYKVIELGLYTEMENDDSIYFIVMKK